MRIDICLVNLGYFKTRTKAKEAINSGIIYYGEKCINKSGFFVKDTNLVRIQGEIMPYVSKGGLKLEKALKEFNINLENKVMLDIGSSTGGFSDCALKNSVKSIIAVDVGTDVMDKSIRENSKITLFENTDFRDIDNQVLTDVEFITIDVSFISVIKLLDKIKELNNINEIVCLIKPQFECGKEIARKYKGIIKDKKVHLNVLSNVIKSFYNYGYYLNNLTYSPITGGDGNIEYLAYFKKEKRDFKYNSVNLVDTAFDNFKK